MGMEDNLKEVKKIALMFPGQGSQYIGMGEWLLDKDDTYRKYLEISSNIIGECLLDVVYDNNSKGSLLELTQFSQISIFSLECAIYDFLINKLKLRKKNIFSVLGHSLGEYSALYSSGVLDYQQGAELVAYRGKIMSVNSAKKQGMMAAVVGEKLDLDMIGEIIDSIAIGKVFIANYNDYSQIVLSGYKFELEKIIQELNELKGKGIKKVIPLKVNVASHCPLMSGVAQKLGEFLRKSVNFRNPVLPFFSTSEVSFINKEDIEKVLIEQLIKPIRWVDSIEYLLGLGIEAFIEVGPSKVLSNLVKRIAGKNRKGDTIVLSTDKWEDIENLEEVLREKMLI